MEEITIRKYDDQHVSGNFQIIKLDEDLKHQQMFEKIHRHDFYYLLAIKAGGGDHHIDFEHYEIQNHSLFLLRPGQVHELSLEKGGSGFILTFDKQFYYPHEEIKIKTFRDLFRNNYYQLDNASFEEIFQTFNLILNENSQELYGYRDAIKGYLNLLFLQLVRKKGISIKEKNSIDHEVIEQFSFLLEQQYKLHKTPQFYAEKLNISTNKLNSISKKILGKTSSQIITEEVILEAKRNLLATTLQIKEIAFLLGFEDDSYFIRFFKKHTNFTPKEFREQ